MRRILSGEIDQLWCLFVYVYNQPFSFSSTSETNHPLVISQYSSFLIDLSKILTGRLFPIFLSFCLRSLPKS